MEEEVRDGQQKPQSEQEQSQIPIPFVFDAVVAMVDECKEAPTQRFADKRRSKQEVMRRV